MNAVAENLKFNFKRWYSNIHIRYLASLHFHSSLEIYACTSTIAEKVKKEYYGSNMK